MLNKEKRLEIYKEIDTLLSRILILIPPLTDGNNAASLTNAATRFMEGNLWLKATLHDSCDHPEVH